MPAGVPPTGCSEGFVHDGDRGCLAILPAERCPFGTMAIPGETICRQVAPCSDGPWGDIPDEPTSQYVDGSYVGGFSDGTMTRPWTTIQQGVDAALPEAIVAVAAGTYSEDVSVLGKPVRLWGRCPSLVTIVGSGNTPASLVVGAGAHGSQVRGFAITGGSRGVGVSDGLEISLRDLWIVDTAGRGIEANRASGPVALQIRNVLIEAAHDRGLVLGSVEATVDEVVIRDTAPAPDDATGPSGAVQIGVVCPLDDCTAAQPSDVSIMRSVVEGSHALGGDIVVRRSRATIADSVLRDLVAAPGAQLMQIGISVQPVCRQGTGCLVDLPSRLTLRGSVIERYRGSALRVAGAEVTVDRVTIREGPPDGGTFFDAALLATAPVSEKTYFEAPSVVTLRQSLIDGASINGIQASWSHVMLEAAAIRRTKGYGSQGGGFGLRIHSPCAGEKSCLESPTATLTMNDSFVDDNASMGVELNGAELTMDGSIVRGTEPVFDGSRGFGVVAHAGCDGGTCDPASRGSALITNSVIDANHGVGVGALSSDVRVEQSIVRGTLSGETAGHGVLAAPLCVTPNACLTDHPGVMAVYGTILEKNHGSGMLAAGAIGHLEGSVVRHTLANAQGRYGDGVVLIHFGQPADGVLLGNRFEAGARVGVANYGSRLWLEANHLGCHEAAYALEAMNGVEAHVDDRGGNRCVCHGVTVICPEAGYELDAPPPARL